jgi:glycosyltransferase involved in cell wall biosynthesis
MSKVSAVISAYNEEGNIERCLKSLSFADEIVVVDNSSSDKTAEIAKEYTKNVYKQKNNPAEIDLQKNFGFTKASNEWILSLDADEEVSKELADEIKALLKKDIKENGFWIPRKNFTFGKWIEHTGWYPDHQLRLFRKGKGKFMDKHVHEKIKIDGEVGYLKNHLLHQNYQTIPQFIHRAIDLYCPSEAEYLMEKGYVFSPFDAIRFPLDEFLSRFFTREGYKDGFHGLMLSLLMAFYRFLVFALIWEKQGFKEVKDDNFLENTAKELKKANQEIMFWTIKEKQKQIKNPLKKNLYKISSKIRP